MPPPVLSEEVPVTILMAPVAVSAVVAAAVCKDRVPVDEADPVVDIPVVMLTAPPFPAEDDPPVTVMSPPTPLADAPTAMAISPPLPCVAAPVARNMAPESPPSLFVGPVDSKISPESEPLRPELSPVVKCKAPEPLPALSLSPEFKVMPPDTPESDVPDVTVTAPPF